MKVTKTLDNFANFLYLLQMVYRLFERTSEPLILLTTLTEFSLFPVKIFSIKYIHIHELLIQNTKFELDIVAELNKNICLLLIE